MDIKNYLTQLFNEDVSLQHLDVTEGTNLYDLLIVPLSYLIETKLSQDILDDSSSTLDLANYEDFTVEELLRIAGNHFIDIAKGGTTRGQVYLYLTSPETIAITKDTQLYSGKVIFRTANAVSFNSTDYVRYGTLYASPPIDIYNQAGASIEENTIGSMDSPPSTLAKFKHAAMKNGVTAKTVSELYSIIRGSLISKVYLNHASIYRLIKEKFPQVGRITVIGAGDDEMERDILYNVAAPNDQISLYSDFSGKIRGYQTIEGTLEVYNSNRAFKVFLSDLGAALDEDSGIELTQQEYLNILDINNGEDTITTSSILEESYEQSSEVGGTVQTIVSNVGDVETKTITLGSVTGLSIGQEVKIISYDALGATQRPVINIIKSINSLVVELYNKIGITFNFETTPTPYIEVLESAGYSLGNGWMKGEDGLALSRTLTAKEVMVINNELVMGTPDTDFKSNVMIEVIGKTGINNFLAAINKALSVDLYSAESAASNTSEEANSGQ